MRREGFKKLGKKLIQNIFICILNILKYILIFYQMYFSPSLTCLYLKRICSFFKKKRIHQTLPFTSAVPSEISPFLLLQVTLKQRET